MPKIIPQHVLVYDVGGSHISAALCSEDTYALHGLTRAPLPAEFSVASFGRLIHTLGEHAAQLASKIAGPLQIPIAGACLAMPGPFDYENGISHIQHKLHSLFEVDLKSALATRFDWKPDQVRFVNDAAAFLLGEVGAGAAKGFSRAIGLTLGTGIGAAFAVDGHIVTSGAGVPPGGEMWNAPYNGATVEDFVSTRFLRSLYQTLTGLDAEVSVIADTAQGDQPCPEIDHTTKPDPNDAHCRARQAFLDFGRHLGLALNQHASTFAPDVIVLGGGIARASQLFLPATRKVLNAGIKAEIVISALMDEAPLAGAGVHWFTSDPA
ncbi:ROK family protein [Acidicapsa ligni]|uniref:ROK family protein n=1 Tax=Acidicapsa ligni TaxID=542300 RepID=UPI0021DFDA21|nr:ROK family protein [Acidicapsa ligni]